MDGDEDEDEKETHWRDKGKKDNFTHEKAD